LILLVQLVFGILQTLQGHVFYLLLGLKLVFHSPLLMVIGPLAKILLHLLVELLSSKRIDTLVIRSLYLHLDTYSLLLLNHRNITGLPRLPAFQWSCIIAVLPWLPVFQRYLRYLPFSDLTRLLLVFWQSFHFQKVSSLQLSRVLNANIYLSVQCLNTCANCLLSVFSQHEPQVRKELIGQLATQISIICRLLPLWQDLVDDNEAKSCFLDVIETLFATALFREPTAKLSAMRFGILELA
jgi:hypothetical protein